MKKIISAFCCVLLVLSLAGCGEKEEEVIFMDGVWEDDWGNKIQFLPEESAYILRTEYGRSGRGSYTAESGLLYFNGFNYTFEMQDDGGVLLRRNGAPYDESEESMDGFVFWPSEDFDVAVYNLSYFDGTWANEYGTTISIDTESMEYDIETESMIGTGTLSDEGDGRGIHLYSDGFVFIEVNDDGSLSFESDDTDFAGTFSAVN